MDIIEKKAREGDVRVFVGAGKREKIGVDWRPEKKQLVFGYAEANGMSFSALIEKIGRAHV